jgi:hypothetical protein
MRYNGSDEVNKTIHVLAAQDGIPSTTLRATKSDLPTQPPEIAHSLGNKQIEVFRQQLRR